MNDGVITGDEMLWWEGAVTVIGLILCLANIAATATHAFMSGSKAWGWSNIMFWPVSFIYSWRALSKKKMKHDVENVI